MKNVDAPRRGNILLLDEVAEDILIEQKLMWKYGRSLLQRSPRFRIDFRNAEEKYPAVRYLGE